MAWTPAYSIAVARQKLPDITISLCVVDVKRSWHSVSRVRVTTAQVVLESADTAVEYQSVRVSDVTGDVIGRDMTLDRSRDNVYVITSSRV